LPGQLPFIQGNPALVNGMAYPQAMAQAQAAMGRGGGRGSMPSMQGLPPNMANMSGMRAGVGGAPTYPQAGARGGMPSIQPGGQMGRIPGGRGAMIPPMGQPGMPQGRDDMGAATSLSNLSQAPPGQQKQMLGEAIYPKIQALQPELAGKITGMLLEMDNSELLGLIDDDAALRAKVEEALSVYDDYMKNRSSGAEGGRNGALKDEEAGKEDSGEGTQA